MEPVEITAGTLHLRSWLPGDEPRVLSACQDPEIQRWTTVPTPYTAADAAAYVREHVPAGWAAGTCLTFAVCASTSGLALASVALTRHDPTRYELGCWAHPDARGRGVVTEAVRTVSRWAFAELAAGRLEWLAEVGNTASQRVAEKAGFVFEGVARARLEHRGRRADAWTAGRLPTDAAAP